MKKILIAIGLAAVVTSSQAQGLINFLNSSATQVTLSSNSVNLGSTPTTLGGFKYELFIAPQNTANPAAFTATGLIATNLASAGRLNGGNNRPVTGAPLGGTGAILVRGWSANLGNNYAEALANQAALGGFLGESPIALNFLWGGDPGTGVAVPASPAFGGSSGIATGFVLNYGGGIVPEPSSMVLAGLGAASLLLFRRRK